MIRLAYLVSRYPAISHTFILREVVELRRLGVDVKTISINPPDRATERLSEEERQEAAHTYVLKGMGKGPIVAGLVGTVLRHPVESLAGLVYALRLGNGAPKATLWRLFYLLEALLIGSWMRQQSVAHLHVHFSTPASTVAMLVKKVFGIPYSLTVHGPDEFYNVEEYHLREKFEGASFICTIGSYSRSQVMKLSDPSHWGKISVAPLGVDGEIFRRHGVRESNGTFEILCVGRLVPAKGQAVLLDAVGRLRHGGRAVRVTLAGDGPDRERLEQAARAAGIDDCCTFLGAVNPDSVRALYETADLFVLPSFAEGIPVVLMEAMAMEVPCISTFVNGIPELIEPGCHGILVAPSDSEGLCEAIARVMDDPGHARALTAAGRRKVLSKYDLKRNVARLRDVFHDYLEAAA